MPTDPTTTSQVQAYRFMLRRMQSALVRKDAVMLHDPMRTHLRASSVGLIVGVLGLAAFFVVGLFKPASQVQAGDIVNVKGTARVYVVAYTEDQPRLLVPVLNETSARLLYAALGHGTNPPRTKSVEAPALADLPLHAEPTGQPGWPQTLPEPEHLVHGGWSVCDTAADQRDAGSGSALSTTVVLGLEPGRELDAAEALLVSGPDGSHYLVWGGHRLPVDMTESGITRPYALENVAARPVSASLINAIPAGKELRLPEIPDAGAGSTFEQLSGRKIGDVVQVERAGQDDTYYLVLREGVQEVLPAVADLIRFSSRTSTDFVRASVSGVPPAPVPLDFSHLPGKVPTVLTTPENLVACLVWRDPNRSPVISVDTDLQSLGGKEIEVPGATADQSQRVLIKSGAQGALVRGVVPGQPSHAGLIWLVTEGRRYHVPNLEVAHVLGYREADPVPAPDAILRLVESGPALDPQSLPRDFDQAARSDGP